MVVLVPRHIRQTLKVKYQVSRDVWSIGIHRIYWWLEHMKELRSMIIILWFVYPTWFYFSINNWLSIIILSYYLYAEFIWYNFFKFLRWAARIHRFCKYIKIEFYIHKTFVYVFRISLFRFLFDCSKKYWRHDASFELFI